MAVKPEGGKKTWHPLFREASYTAGVGAVIWTLVIILPVQPFASIPPIIAGGGPGTWFVLAYLLYILAGFVGLSVLSSMVYFREVVDSRKLSDGMMSVGLVLFYGGVTITCLLLGIAGYRGGYAITISSLPVTSVEAVLLPYVDSITIGALVACVGALVLFSNVILAPRRPVQS
jgi:heme/copper-type cytochrome/quinol oxidase subunit 1